MDGILTENQMPSISFFGFTPHRLFSWDSGTHFTDQSPAVIGVLRQIPFIGPLWPERHNNRSRKE